MKSRFDIDDYVIILSGSNKDKLGIIKNCSQHGARYVYKIFLGEENGGYNYYYDEKELKKINKNLIPFM